MRIRTNDIFDALMGANVIKRGHFKLTSGNHSNIYIQKDLIHHHPSTFDLVTNTLNHLSDNFEYDVVTGPAIAGAIIAREIATCRAKPFVYPEKVIDYDVLDEMEHEMQLTAIAKEEIPTKMVFRRGHDKFISGKRVLIVEDIITTGGSVMDTVDAIDRHDGIVAGVVVIWNRSGWNTYKNHSIINRKADHWPSNECPLCMKNIPITDPKS